MNPEDRTGWRTVAMIELVVLVTFVLTWVVREAYHGEEIQSAYEKAAEAFEPKESP